MGDYTPRMKKLFALLALCAIGLPSLHGQEKAGLSSAECGPFGPERDQPRADRRRTDGNLQAGREQTRHIEIECRQHLALSGGGLQDQADEIAAHEDEGVDFGREAGDALGINGDEPRQAQVDGGGEKGWGDGQADQVAIGKTRNQSCVVRFGGVLGTRLT